jgi:hypothetical protein
MRMGARGLNVTGLQVSGSMMIAKLLLVVVSEAIAEQIAGVSSYVSMSCSPIWTQPLCNAVLLVDGLNR